MEAVPGVLLALAIATLSIKNGRATELAKNFKESSLSFAANLYSNVIKEKTGENVIISPFSVQTAAALLFIGASGETAQQMITGLKLTSEDRNIVATTYKNILDQHENSPIIKIANKLYLSPKVDALQSFLDLAIQKFNSDVQNIDFENADKAAKEINAWVEEKTAGKIKNLVDSGSIDSFTSGVILNAVHFKGSWTQKFDINKTKKREFWIGENESVEVDMMKNVGKYGIAYIDHLETSLIELNFENSKFSMVIVLPHKRTGLDHVEAELLKNNFEDLSVEFSSRKVEIFLPKFTAECSTELKEAFKQMGMSKMFVNAEFYNLSQDYMQVSEILHKSYIDVNEEGAEVVASSGIQLNARSGPFSIVVDHPFMYYIKGAEGEIYFIGRYVKP